MLKALDRVLRGPAVAVDLGTSTTRVAAHGCAPLEHPNVPGNHEAAIEVLRRLLAQVSRTSLLRPRALACVPSDLGAAERDALVQRVQRAGASSVALVPEPLAAAVGAGIDVSDEHARLLVDIGEGVTDCALIRQGRVVLARAARVGCAQLHRSVKSMLRARFDVIVGRDEAERVVRSCGVEPPTDAGATVQLNGFAPRTRRWISTSVPATQVIESLEPDLARMFAAVHSLLRDLSHELGAQVIEDGLHLTGGGALLPGMRRRLERESRIRVHVPKDPRGAVIRGAHAMLPIAAATGLWTS